MSCASFGGNVLTLSSGVTESKSSVSACCSELPIPLSCANGGGLLLGGTGDDMQWFKHWIIPEARVCTNALSYAEVCIIFATPSMQNVSYNYAIM